MVEAQERPFALTSDDNGGGTLILGLCNQSLEQVPWYTEGTDANILKGRHVGKLLK